MIKITFEVQNPDEFRTQLTSLLGCFGNPVENPPLVEVPKEPTPVISMAQMEENVQNAPQHEPPKPPTLEEVRAALKELRDRKGAGAVRELLKAYNADSLTGLKPEDYLGALARAKTEV